MRPEIQNWINELKSGKWTQTVSRLAVVYGKDDTRYCCLGVLCELSTLPKNPRMGGIFHSIEYGVDGEVACLPPEVYKPLNIKTHGQFRVIEGFPLIEEAEAHYKAHEGEGADFFNELSLVKLNDKCGFTFAQIAEVVEFIENNDLWIPYVEGEVLNAG